MTWGYFRSSLWRVDPEGILSRTTQATLIIRRKYCVPGSLALWHVDGNHKLIRWGFVIHRAIDGFSLKIMYFKCSTNVMTSTVLDLFINAANQFGLPSRVCTDQGVENVDIARYMFIHHLHGPARRSFIAGKSCHNQRIERLWRDVFSVVLSIFCCVYGYLEENGYLDVSDEVHLCFPLSLCSVDQQSFKGIYYRMGKSPLVN